MRWIIQDEKMMEKKDSKNEFIRFFVAIWSSENITDNNSVKTRAWKQAQIAVYFSCFVR